MSPPKIGLALGSGSARGMAHIGVIRALEKAGIRADVVCGSSIGAVVGAALAAGSLDAYEAAVRKLTRRQVLGHFDLALRGGLIRGLRVFELFKEQLPNREIASLPMPFAATATDLFGGHEVWMRDGLLHDALRASVAIPGLVSPVQRNGRWLVDGGVVDPVPVSLCRALGAEIVIAVDLNSTLLTGHFRRQVQAPNPPAAPAEEFPVEVVEEAGDTEDAEAEPAAPEAAPPAEGGLESLRRLANETRHWMFPEKPVVPGPPSIYEVVSTCLEVVQVRMTRSRMAGDPPDLLITPHFKSFGLMEFERAAEAINEGRRAAESALATALTEDWTAVG